jgi:Flp pilus assembly secretin CpaC
MMKFGFWLNLSALALLTAAGAPAMASEQLTVQTDKTQLISVSAEPGTVVVGNPSIADVTVSGKQIFVHGRAFGDTNLMILDAAGNQIANFDITVAHNPTNAVALYRAGVRTSYTCAPLCEVTMQPGDPLSYTDELIKVNGSKAGLATGVKPSSSEASQ